jgi:hypothetical protein
VLVGQIIVKKALVIVFFCNFFAFSGGDDGFVFCQFNLKNLQYNLFGKRRKDDMFVRAI